MLPPPQQDVSESMRDALASARLTLEFARIDGVRTEATDFLEEMLKEYDTPAPIRESDTRIA